MNTESDNDTVRLVDVGIDNFDDLVDLAPLESRYARPFGIHAGDERVAFLMIGYDISDEDAVRGRIICGRKWVEM